MILPQPLQDEQYRILNGIAQTIRAVFRIVTERPLLRASTRRAISTPVKPTKLGRPDKIVPRPI